MANERSILCGDVSSNALLFDEKKPLLLNLWGKQSNVSLCINNISSPIFKNIASPFQDLIEIATYVYCADQAITRGGNGVDNFGENWRRKLFFRIAIRNPDLWNSLPLKDQLIETLSFLSEDEYHFDFVKLEKQPAIQKYLDFDIEPQDEVMMFSGGLDSLGGAIQEAVTSSRKIVMVTHMPTQKLKKRHGKLVELLSEKAAYQPLQIPVTINKSRSLSREYTQRNRSFLYAALGATVAQMFNLSRLRFYENGVISLNLPISSQVVGARATRTTHPKVIKGFTEIFSTLAGKPFLVENPFLGKTKTEVLTDIVKAGCSDTIKFSTSCTHTWEMTKLRTHCGTCSQCIDRRFAVLAANAQEYDPAEAYGVDLLIGERSDGEPKTMLAAYVESANEVADMKPFDFFGRYGETARILSYLNGSADSNALQIYELYRRHSKSVTKVVDDAIAKNRIAIRKRQLPESCLLRLVCDSGGIQVEAEDSGAKSDYKLLDNYIRLKGQCWTTRYQGNEEKIYYPDIGFFHLQILLENPGTVFSVFELDVAVSRMTKNEIFASVSAGETPSKEGSNILGQSDSGPIHDADALQSYLIRLEEIEEELDEAHSNNDLSVSKTLIDEKAWISSELSKAKGTGGKMRNLGDEREKVRGRVGNAIRRVLKKMKQYDKPLFKHLKKPVLNLGYKISYVPRDGLTWSSKPNQNS